MKINRDFAFLNNLDSLLTYNSIGVLEAARLLELNKNTISTFLNGKSHINSYDFMRVLKLAGINLRAIVRDELEKREQSDTPIGEDMELILKELSKHDKRSILKDVIASSERYAKKNKTIENSRTRLKEHLQEMRYKRKQAKLC